MKAKEYAEEFKKIVDINNANEEKLRDAVTWLILGISEEAAQIMKDRKCKCNSAVLAVIKEQDQKWKAICRLMPNVLNPDGFKRLWLKRLGLDKI